MTEQARHLLLLIETGRVCWRHRGAVGVEFHTGNTLAGTYESVPDLANLAERYYERVNSDREESGPVRLSPAGEQLLAELDDRTPPPSVWSRS